MLREFVEIVFGLGLFLNALFFIPQAIKVYKTKSARGLSLTTFLGFNLMQLFTAWHGYLVGDFKLMLGFLLAFLTCGVVIYFILKYRE